MKRYIIIVRQRIIDPYTRKYHDDKGLKALDGYCEKEIVVEESCDEEMLLRYFLKQNPQFENWDFEIIEK